MEWSEQLINEAREEIRSESPSDVDTLGYLVRAIDVLNDVASEAPEPSQGALLAASASLLVAASGPQAIGQCKEAEPFAKIYVVFDSQGHRFECEHKPPHTSPM